jgi:hypothetical protein
MFDEIAGPPPNETKATAKKQKKSAPKPITSTNLRQENLDAAKLLLNAGIACVLREGEECENTALAVERVASDLISLTGAVAKALNQALQYDEKAEDGGAGGADPILLKKWVEFYSEDLAPKTRAMVKKTAPKLDAFSLFLPSRASDTVSQDLIQKGLKLGEMESVKVENVATTDNDADNDGDIDEAAAVGFVEEEEEGSAEKDNKEVASTMEESSPRKNEATEGEEDALDEEAELDEYEYEEDEEYYDDEDGL